MPRGVELMIDPPPSSSDWCMETLLCPSSRSEQGKTAITVASIALAKEQGLEG